MRRHQVVALCLAVGALIAAAITPGVIGSGKPPAKPDVPAGYTLDRVVTNPDGSTLTYAHRFRELKPGDPGYVPEPKKGEPGWEPTGGNGR